MSASSNGVNGVHGVSSRSGKSPGLAASSRVLHARAEPKPGAPPLVGGLVQSTTYVQPHVGATGVHAYTRVSNPSVDETEAILGALEDAPPAVCFASGLAAETALFLALLRAGDHIVAGDAIYGGTVRLLRQVLSELGVSATFVDTRDAQSVARAITPRTRLVFIETPANPTLKLTDIAAVAAVCKAAHGGAGVLLAVDNTFLTPILQRPLELGADICVYATTKLIEGHSTACGGAVVTRDTAVLDRVRWIRKCTGGIQTPMGAWLTTRGLKTLPLRVREQSSNAQTIAEWLEGCPLVSRVHYPGLASFPDRALAERQHASINGTRLHGSVVAFEVIGGVEGGRRVLEGARLCALVEHVGSVETLLTHPATMTHADVPAEQRRAAGIGDGLIRLSVGLEDPADVIADLDQALIKAHPPTVYASGVARVTVPPNEPAAIPA